MGLCRHYRLHNHKLYRPVGIIHLKYLETTIGYTLFYYLFVSKIKNNPKYLL